MDLRRQIKKWIVFGSAWLILLLGACQKTSSEEPVHVCVPDGQCPDISTQLAGGDGDAEEGKRLYQLHCSTCHGSDGKGNKPGVGDLTSRTGTAKSRPSQLAATIRNGRGEAMPAFPLSEKAISDLVKYVQTLGTDVAPPANPQYP